MVVSERVHCVVIMVTYEDDIGEKFSRRNEYVEKQEPTHSRVRLLKKHDNSPE